jgi:hypothetical protein
MNGFLTKEFSRTGGTGKTIAVGKGREPGASRTINLGHHGRDRS